MLDLNQFWHNQLQLRIIHNILRDTSNLKILSVMLKNRDSLGLMNLFLKMVLFTKVILKMEYDMALALKYGPMVQNMKVNGVLTKLTEKENSGMLMEMFTTDYGKMIKQMDMASMFMLTEQNMKGTGEMIYKMEMGLNPGVMEANMKVVIMKV
jgi:hypothetical protein